MLCKLRYFLHAVLVGKLFVWFVSGSEKEDHKELVRLTADPQVWPHELHWLQAAQTASTAGQLIIKNSTVNLRQSPVLQFLGSCPS